MDCGNATVEVKAGRFLISFNEKIEKARLTDRAEVLEQILGSRKKRS